MKKFYIITPILADWCEVKVFSKMLSFLSNEYNLEFIDPLCDIHNDMSPAEFFQLWQSKLTQHIDNYDVFIGFSLGGVILQNNLNMLLNHNKKVILFSTPSFIDDLLKQKLQTIYNLILNKQLMLAIETKNNYVFHPNPPPPYIDLTIYDNQQATLRLSKGLMFILNVDSRSISKNHHKPYLHFIGLNSALVNTHNVWSPINCRLMVVPSSGMRVLEDNLNFCQSYITNFIEDASNE